MDDQVQGIMAAVLEGALALLATVLTGLFAWGARSLKQWLDSEAHTASFACATEKLERLTTEAVLELEQTLVRKLKVEGQWNVATAREVRDEAVAVVKRHLGDRGLAELKGCLGLGLKDLEGLIRTKIESIVGSETKIKNKGPIVLSQ